MKNSQFLNKMCKILKRNEFEKYLKSFEKPSKKSIRININKIDVESFEKQSTFKLIQNKVLDNCFYVENDEKIGNTLHHFAGAFYVQEPAASVPVYSIKEELKDKIVLDVCACPGGKTGQLAEFVGENGFVISNEYVSKRVNILRGNIERLGYNNVAIISNDGEKLGKVLANKIDVVVVDAPCSGEGMFRKDSSTMQEWNESIIESNAKRQFEILQNVCKCVKNNGKLVYSTCTFDKKENECVVFKFLNSNPKFKLVELSKNICSVSSPGIEDDEDSEKLNLNYCRRFYPQDDFGEGQFVAVMQKQNENINENISKIYGFDKLNGKEEKIVEEFFVKNFNFKDLSFGKIGGQVFILPNNYISLNGLNVVTFGVCAGEFEKYGFAPHHNLYMSFGLNSKNILNATETQAKDFVSGAQLFSADVVDGFVSVCYNGLCLGFGKAKNGTINNHYPKGLRKIIK